ncbi:MAG: HAMP domain-containing histidine kinase [Blastochloris sp.]|nr:HAMP domain-containing histidine kinase [Blastochloris sp.]
MEDEKGKLCGGLVTLTRADANTSDLLRVDETINALRVQLLRAVSHELRSPLSIIKGFSSSLLVSDVTWDGDRQRKFISIIDETADRMQEVVDRMRDYALLEAGTFRLSVQATTLSAILDSIMPRVRDITQNHRFTLDLDADMQPLVADSKRIAQVVLELLNNAVKFSPPGTAITMQAEQKPDMLEVRVHDEGQGIPQEHYEHVFEPFWQPLGENRQKGAGLGLALARGIAQMHGGYLHIEPNRGRGTTVVFGLPTLES